MTTPNDAAVDVIAVTPEQSKQIEAAWRICSGGTRKISGEWVKRFESSVSTILGFMPPTSFKLDATPALRRFATGGE